MQETIRDYIGWRGDLSFEERALTDADNLVLCFLSYINFRSIWKTGCPMTVKEAVDALLQNGGIHLEMIAGSEHPEEIVIAAAESERFGALLIKDYVDLLIPEEHVQYSATLFELDEQHSFIAYRGTDDSTAGWKEDFMITFTKTKAQELALGYLRDRLSEPKEENRHFIVAGHSKGGNLAMYASAFLTEEERSRIDRVYVNDGPGFCGDVLDASLLEKIDPITTNIIPYYCVVGKLFEPQFSDIRIVDSVGTGIMQHACETWVLDHGALKTVPENDPQSRWINNVMDCWVEQVSMEERRQFIDQMFEAIEDENTSFTELLAKGPLAFENILIRIIGTDKAVKQTLFKMPETAVKESVNPSLFAMWDNTADATKAFLYDLCFLITGIALIIIPQNFIAVLAGILLGIFALIEFAVTFRRLYRNHFNLREETTRLMVCSILLAIILVLAVKDGALFLMGSAVFGAALILLGVRGITQAQASAPKTFQKHFHIAEACILILLGLFILVAPQETMRWYCSSAGYLLILDGAVRLYQRYSSSHSSK